MRIESRHLLSAIALYPTQQSWNVYIFVIANIHSFTFQIFGVVGPLGENLDIFSPLGFDVQTNSDHKTQKIKFYSVRAFKRYLSEKNLIHGRVMATILKFSRLMFETYFSLGAIKKDARTWIIALPLDNSCPNEVNLNQGLKHLSNFV